MNPVAYPGRYLSRSPAPEGSGQLTVGSGSAPAEASQQGTVPSTESSTSTAALPMNRPAFLMRYGKQRTVIPAKAGIQALPLEPRTNMDPRFRRDDALFIGPANQRRAGWRSEHGARFPWHPAGPLL
jgi:hypothetical protein